MGLLAQALAGGLAGGAKSLAGSIGDTEKMRYQQMLEDQRQQHEEYLAGLQRQWRNEDQPVGVDAQGLPVTRGQYESMDDDGRGVVRNAKEYEDAHVSPNEQKTLDAKLGLIGAQTDLERERINTEKVRSKMGGSLHSGSLSQTFAAIDETPGLSNDEKDELKRKAVEKAATYKDNSKAQKMGKDDVEEANNLKDEAAAAFDAGNQEKGKELLDLLNERYEYFGRPQVEYVPKKLKSKSLIGSDEYENGYFKSKGKSVESSMIDAESSGDQGAVSPKGARGKTQLMPGTAKDLKVNPDDEFENVAGGFKNLAQLRAKYKDDAIALAAYNWGPGNVDKWLASGGDMSRLPKETREYIDKVLSNSASWKSEKAKDLSKYYTN